MKKIYMLLLTVSLAAASIAQVPDKMSYQAVIRDTEGNLVTEQEIGMQISILQGTADGTAAYIETQTPTTNANGLVSIEIGGDDATAVSGNFALIDWSDGPWFIKTETDPSGGTDYTITGISQLLSVPYALHSGSSDVLTGEITESQISDLQNYLTEETDPLFDASPVADIKVADIGNWDEAHSWGDHAGEGYLTEETDPVFEDSPAAGIEAADITNWNEAHSWGDHAEAEYLTEETDPLFSTSVASEITQEDVESWDAKSEFDGEFGSLTGVPNSVIMPAGVINIFAGSIAPDGYLICDGSEVSRTEYADLFAVIGTTYGEGDGSTTFKLPDLQSRIPVGISAEPEFNELGKTGGTKEHELTVDEMPAHSHGGSIGFAGSHNHGGRTYLAGQHRHSGTTYGSGGSGSKLTYDGLGMANRVAYHMGSHTHDFVTNTVGDHEHGIPFDGNHNHSISIQNSGGGNPHNNLQPYIVLNFIIKY